jgi:hypothetical protein
VQREIINSTGIAFGATYLTLFFSVYIVSRTLTRPVIALTRTTQLIGEGDYNQDLGFLQKGRLRDEIVTLAEVFQVMVDKVHQREQNLVRQVQELQIQIDTEKRQKQVSEIVDTEFFQELKEKANAMRSRRGSPGQMGARGATPNPTPASTSNSVGDAATGSKPVTDQGQSAGISPQIP